MPVSRDYYDILGVDRSATAAAIKQAYRRKALEFHPDRNKSPQAETQFKQINQAYEVLSNPQKRTTYDQFGHAAFQSDQNRTGRAGPFTYTYTSGGAGSAFNFGGFSDPFEIFESFFGGAGAGRRTPPKTHYSLKINLEEAFRGVEKTLVHQGKQYTIKIPAGADDGTRVRYTDFDVSLDVLPHSTFSRDGRDLIIDHRIPFTTAALGGSATVPTLEGSLQIRIRPGTQPGTIIRLKGKGMPQLQGFGRGDQYIRLIITIPQSLTRQQKQLLRELHQLI